jgi:glyoxylase I family protein
MPDGHQQEPGGWNRLVQDVGDLPALVAAMTDRRLRFRNQIVSGPGGKQSQLLEPDENAIELFAPAPRPVTNRL